MFLGAANREPRRWTRPDEFDLDRDPSGHVGSAREFTSASRSLPMRLITV
jgi:cytochrome P450